MNTAVEAPRVTDAATPTHPEIEALDRAAAGGSVDGVSVDVLLEVLTLIRRQTHACGWFALRASRVEAHGCVTARWLHSRRLSARTWHRAVRVLLDLDLVERAPERRAHSHPGRWTPLLRSCYRRSKWRHSIRSDLGFGRLMTKERRIDRAVEAWSSQDEGLIVTDEAWMRARRLAAARREVERGREANRWRLEREIQALAGTMRLSEDVDYRLV